MDLLEQQVLQMLLAGDDPVLSILRRQLEIAQRAPREYSGVGFFTHFRVPLEAPRLPGGPSFRFGDVIAEMDGLEHGAAFVLFVDGGVLTMLEGYTYDESWQQPVSSINLKYINGKTRDFALLRATPGWPTKLF